MRKNNSRIFINIKPFRINRKIKYLTFEFDLCPWGQGHNFFLFSFICLLYGANLRKIDQAVQDLSQNEIFDL